MSESDDIKNTTEEIKQHFENPEFGIDTDQLIAFVDYKKKSWKIDPKGHTKQVRDKIIEIEDEYKAEFDRYQNLPEKDQTQKLKYEIAEKATRKILETGLIGFNYDAMAEDESAGPKILQMLSDELVVFLVESGGKAGHRHLEMLQKLTTLNHYISSTGFSRSGTSTSTPKGE